jgi:hypothetical protein
MPKLGCTLGYVPNNKQSSELCGQNPLRPQISTVVRNEDFRGRLAIENSSIMQPKKNRWAGTLGLKIYFLSLGKGLVCVVL